MENKTLCIGPYLIFSFSYSIIVGEQKQIQNYAQTIVYNFGNIRLDLQFEMKHT